MLVLIQFINIGQLMILCFSKAEHVAVVVLVSLADAHALLNLSRRASLSISLLHPQNVAAVTLANLARGRTNGYAISWLPPHRTSAPEAGSATLQVFSAANLLVCVSPPLWLSRAPDLSILWSAYTMTLTMTKTATTTTTATLRRARETFKQQNERR